MNLRNFLCEIWISKWRYTSFRYRKASTRWDKRLSISTYHISILNLCTRRQPFILIVLPEICLSSTLPERGGSNPHPNLHPWAWGDITTVAPLPKRDWTSVHTTCRLYLHDKKSDLQQTDRVKLTWKEWRKPSLWCPRPNGPLWWPVRHVRQKSNFQPTNTRRAAKLTTQSSFKRCVECVFYNLPWNTGWLRVKRGTTPRVTCRPRLLEGDPHSGA